MSAAETPLPHARLNSSALLAVAGGAVLVLAQGDLRAEPLCVPIFFAVLCGLCALGATALKRSSSIQSGR
jgi:hypothetical protein